MKLKVLLSLPKPYVLLLPLLGLGIFILFYIVAAINYPGGSWAYPNQAKFSLRHNYLCDLLDNYSTNGTINSAKYYARFSLGFLCGSIILIWFYLPNLFEKQSFNSKTMWLYGIMSLLVIG